MAAIRGIGNDIIQLRESGKTYGQISKELNCSKNTINYHCKKAGLTDIGFKNVKIGDEIANQIYEFRKTHNVKETAKKFGLSLACIRKYSKQKNHNPN